MYETKQETAGLRGCLGRSKPSQRIECVPASVLYEGRRNRASLQEDGARARRQTSTGNRHDSLSNDDAILAGKLPAVRLGAKILAALTICGIVPALLAAALDSVARALHCSWIGVPLLVIAVAAIWRAVGRDER